MRRFTTTIFISACAYWVRN